MLQIPPSVSLILIKMYRKLSGQKCSRTWNIPKNCANYVYCFDFNSIFIFLHGERFDISFHFRSNVRFEKGIDLMVDSIFTDLSPAPLAPPTCAARCAVQTPDKMAGGDVRERRLAKFRQNVARFRLYRLRFLQENMRFAAFFKIYQILKLKFLKFDNILQILRHLQFLC